MITRKTFLSTIVGLPPLLLSFLIGKKEEKPNYQAIRDSFMESRKVNEMFKSLPKADAIFYENGCWILNKEATKAYKKYVDGPFDPRWLQELLVRDGFVVETQWTDEKGTLRREVRYRL